MQFWRYFLLLLGSANASIYLVLVFGDDSSCLDLDLTATKSLSRESYKKVMTLAAFPYIFQTTWRCFFISEYPNRRTYTNNPMNSVLVARLLAAVGEFCFGVQLALALYTACLSASLLGPILVLRCVLCLVVLDAIGQCCATYGTVMGSSFPFFLEGLLWASIFSICFVLASTSIFGHVGTGYTPLLLFAVVVMTPPAILYMVFGYCPMCWQDWCKEAKESLLRNGRKDAPSFRSKAWEALTFRSVTQEWSIWSHECTWQTLYFSVGTWASLLLIIFPLQQTPEGMAANAR